MTRISKDYYSSKIFQGACIDNQAQCTFCGLKRANTYCKGARITFCLKISPFAFKFGNLVCGSKGIMEFRDSLANRYIPGQADVVVADVPLLFSLVFLNKEKILAENLSNVLKCKEYLGTSTRSKEWPYVLSVDDYLEFYLQSTSCFDYIDILFTPVHQNY